MESSPNTAWPPPQSPMVAPVMPHPATRPVARRRLWTWVMVASFVVSAVALLAFALDWGSRNVAMASLVTEIEESEAAMAAVNAGVSGIAAGEPDTGGGGSAQSRALRTELEDFATRSRADVAAAGSGLDAVWVLPWQSEILAARDAYISHHEAWLRYLEAASADSSVFFTEVPDIGLTWGIAEDSLRAARPEPAWPGISARIDALFDQQPTGQGTYLDA